MQTDLVLCLCTAVFRHFASMLFTYENEMALIYLSNIRFHAIEMPEYSRNKKKPIVF